MHCHLLFISAAVVLTLVFAIGLVETTPLIDLTVKGFYLLFSISFGQAAYLLFIVTGLVSFCGPRALPCDLGICTTRAESVVTKTLLFHTYYSCAGSVTMSCTHNHTT
jgi:hypothetical protein